MSNAPAVIKNDKKENSGSVGVYNAAEKRYQFFWAIFFLLVSLIAIVPILRVISISFSSKDFLVSRVILTDADGGSTRISFSNQKTN